jgi:Ribosomal protein L24e
MPKSIIHLWIQLDRKSFARYKNVQLMDDLFRGIYAPHTGEQPDHVLCYLALRDLFPIRFQGTAYTQAKASCSCGGTARCVSLVFEELQSWVMTTCCIYTQVFRFTSSRNSTIFLQRKNLRKIKWTQMYRRMHQKKGYHGGSGKAVLATDCEAPARDCWR